jgi:hypothetical protein
MFLSRGTIRLIVAIATSSRHRNGAIVAESGFSKRNASGRSNEETIADGEKCEN